MALNFSPRPFTRHRGLWLRWVLLCTLFSALHGLLGAWVVPAVSSGPVAEICTPNGLQWVALDGAPAEEHPADWPQGLAQPCAWASAHVAMSAAAGSDIGVPHPPPATTLRLAGVAPDTRAPGNADRVLLMAPMRAPPA